jgi:demethylmenaquinone methyltransferase / 2-methoxy-6-polyprenyl-1,4-benzoquinol methylase
MNNETILSQGKEKYIHNIFSEIAPAYEFINHMLSLNLDRLWRRKAIARFYRSSHQHILDVCCGTGELTEILRQKVGAEGSITGVDFCENMLDLACKRHQGIKNVQYHIGNAQKLQFDTESFDAVYNCFALRNLLDIRGAIQEMKRVVKSGGQVIIIDLTLPHSPLFRWYLTYVVPFIGRLCHGDKGPYSYLSASIRLFCTPQQLRDQFEDAGLQEVEYEEYLGGVVTAVCGTVR